MTFLTRMTERAGSARRLSLVSIVGLVLVPFVIAGVLVWALWNPQDRLDTVTAAIVNNDEPVTVNGQTVPLGRELVAGLVGTAKPGSKKAGQNFTWTITDSSDAASGLASGAYTAVLTIPKDFSAAATSTTKASTARQAKIDVRTSDSSKLLDATISRTITQTAASLTGSELTANYLDNVFVGFTTLNDKIGEAADGARALASQGGTLTTGLSQAAVGQHQLADGLATLSTGAASLSTGAGALAQGTRQLSSGASTLASGAQATASGAQTTASGAQSLATGTSRLSDAADRVSTGAGGVAQGLDQLDTQTQQASAQLVQLGQLGQSLTNSSAAIGALSALQPDLSACAADPAANATQCQTAAAGVSALTTELDPSTLSPLATALAGAGDQLGQLAALPVAVSKLATAADQVAAGADGVASGLTQSASGASGLASGAARLSTGVQQLAGGASRLAAGAAQTDSGAQRLSTGASSLASGTAQAATGAQRAAAGSDELSAGAKRYVGGVQKLSTGLATAVASIPSYTDAQAAKLSKIVATPVATTSAAAVGFGELAAPIFGVLALWLGALASFVVLRPVSVRALGSPRSSVAVALRGLVLPALIGAVQGIAVAGALQPLLRLSLGPWLGLAGVGVLTGVAFAAVNQALVALFGGTGRFASMVVILLGLATGLVGTAPTFMTTLTDFTPVGPAQHLVGAVVQGAAPPGAAIAGLALWLLGAIAATTLAVARGRVVPASKLQASVVARAV